MARGSRPRHGAEVEAQMHAHRDVMDGSAIIPTGNYVAITCWCERHTVAVPQYVFRHEGRTLSCGGTSTQRCVGPNKEDEIGYLLPASPPDNVDAWLKRYGTVTKKYPRLVTVKAPMPVERPTPATIADVTTRREEVAVAWRQGLQPPDIARLFGLAIHTVRNDLQLLRKRGRI